MTTDIDSALNKFREVFGGEAGGAGPSCCVFAPGRVNLIGEHTDYNGGFVFPFALPYRTLIVGKNTTVPDGKTQRLTRIYSCNMPDSPLVEFNINDRLAKGEPFWANYVKGTIFQYLKDIPGNASFDAVITSNVPIGSGLSSSASLEVAVGMLLERLFNVKNMKAGSEDGVTRALRCQKAEHDFADTPCGIMDQYISSMGQAGKILLIDCRSQSYELVEVGGDKNDPDRPVMLVANSNVKHNLSQSEYPVRRQQCEAAVKIISQKYPEVKLLRDVTLSMLEESKDAMSPVCYRRAKHVVTEDIRTKSTVEALKNGDFTLAGSNMTKSHASLQADFEVSCAELDLLVELALEVPGVFGSRMTGGGFGGCTITLVKKSAVVLLRQYLIDNYKKRAKLDCECYEVVPSAGASEIDLATRKSSSSSSSCKAGCQCGASCQCGTNCQCSSSSSSSSPSPSSSWALSSFGSRFSSVLIPAFAIGIIAIGVRLYFNKYRK